MTLMVDTVGVPERDDADVEEAVEIGFCITACSGCTGQRSLCFWPL